MRMLLSLWTRWQAAVEFGDYILTSIMALECINHNYTPTTSTHRLKINRKHSHSTTCDSLSVSHPDTEWRERALLQGPDVKSGILKPLFQDDWWTTCLSVSSEEMSFVSGSPSNTFFVLFSSQVSSWVLGPTSQGPLLSHTTDWQSLLDDWSPQLCLRLLELRIVLVFWVCVFDATLFHI